MGLTDREARRIERVYRGYRADPATRARWASTSPGNRRILLERDRVLGELLGAEGLLPFRGRILDLGCGSGGALGSARRLGAPADQLVGVDLLEDRLSEAREGSPDPRLVGGDARRLPFGDGTFRLVLAFTLFSSLSPDAAAGTAAEVRRVLAPGGAVVWYDVRMLNPWNPHTRSFRARGVRALFPGYASRLRSVTPLPPLARRIGPLYPALAALPPLRSHYLGLLRKPPEAPDA